MPNFFTHWLVALNAIDGAPSYIKEGKEKYDLETQKFKSELTSHIALAQKSMDNYWAFCEAEFDEVCSEYDAALRKEENYDDITCFSAYMLGACGPDFWTLVSDSKRGLLPDTAGLHFDFGHYNRTHMQFVNFLKRLASKSTKKDHMTLQDKVEASYFYGMATHFGADLIIHQLVNVYAGAYNLLEKVWESEHGALKNVKNLWTIHNKVEHWWDSYLRYRYFSDYGPIWPEEGYDKDDWFDSLEYPVTEKIISDIKKAHGFFAPMPVSHLVGDLSMEGIKLKIEKCYNFPGVVCDRIISGDLKYFLYDIVVDKRSGAYPEECVNQAAIDEANHFQFSSVGYTEKLKLTYFSAEKTKNSSTTGANYLTYYVMPRLKRMKKYARNVFYHPEALREFMKSAIPVAEIFMQDLRSSISEAITKGRQEAEWEPDIGRLARYWNLDIGVGMDVVAEQSDSRCEIITKLRLFHILENLDQPAIEYKRDNTYTKKKKPKTFKNPKEVPIFKTYQLEKEFKNYIEIEEKDDKKYLERIRFEKGERSISTKSITTDVFFGGKEIVLKKKPTTAPTKTLGERRLAKSVDVKHRLTICIESTIADIDGGKEPLSFYFYGDNKNSMLSAAEFVKGDKHLGHYWLINKKKYKKRKTRGLDFIEAGASKSLVVDGVTRYKRDDRKNLCTFYTSFLVSLEQEKGLTRVIEKKKWNNVVDYEHFKERYGRNYAIGTGRKNILLPEGGGQFWAGSDFYVYKNLSPADYIFISLYVFVRDIDGNTFDAISKEEVSKEDLERVKKIECVGFVKLILFYDVDREGVFQLDRYFLDGNLEKVK